MVPWLLTLTLTLLGLYWLTPICNSPPRLRCSSGWHRTPAVAVLLSAYLKASATGRWMISNSTLFECQLLFLLLSLLAVLCRGDISYNNKRLLLVMFFRTTPGWAMFLLSLRSIFDLLDNCAEFCVWLGLCFSWRRPKLPLQWVLANWAALIFKMQSISKLWTPILDIL